MTPEARARLQRLLEAARRAADPHAPQAEAWRERIRASSGLSREGVDLALSRCLETEPSEAELVALAASVPAAPVSHVLLSANVFVAAHRAIGLALAASPKVEVRPSRREPEMARWLAEAAPELFRLVDTITPASGEQVFAYGRQATLDELSRTLPPAVRLLAHGPGFGLVVCDESALSSDELCQRLATALALDVVLFDQRGCLSPRLILIEASAASALRLARALAVALSDWQRRVPLGVMSAEEHADKARYASTLAYAGELLTAGQSVIGVGALNSALALPPVGRNLHLLPVSDARARASALSASLTTYAVAGSATLAAALARILPRARASTPGRMQCPPFDGAVDRRVHSALLAP